MIMERRTVVICILTVTIEAVGTTAIVTGSFHTSVNIIYLDVSNFKLN